MKKTKWIIGSLVIVAVIVTLSLLKLGDSIVYFYTPQEVFAPDLEVQGKNIKIGGMVKVGSVQKDMANMRLTFMMTDFKGHDIVVQHRGTPPDLFKEGQGVVAEGYFDRQQRMLQSHTLMVKHSEEYRVPHDTEMQNKELLIKSILGN